MAKVYFKEGSQDDYNSVTPDENSFYKVENNDSSDEDEFDVYLGGIQLNNGRTIASLIAQIEDLDQRVYDLENPPTLLGNYTAAQVLEIVNAGEAENYWSIGDVTEPIELNGTVGVCTFDNESYRAMIIGFNHNAELETDGCYSMTLQFGQNEDGVNIAFIDGYEAYDSGDRFVMNTSNTNAGGWKSCYMKNQIMEEFYEVLPNSLQNIIGTTIKYTDNVGDASGSVESNVTATEDKIFVLSALEVFSSSSYANTYEGNYQERYAWYSANDSDDARMRYRHSASNSTAYWWLRSPARSTGASFCTVTRSGSASAGTAYSSIGLAPAFTIIGGNTMPTWTFDLILYIDKATGEKQELSEGFFDITGSKILGFDDLGTQEEGYTLYTAIYHSDSAVPRQLLCPSLRIQNLKRETILNLKMYSAPDGYNLLTDDITVTLESDGQTAYYNTTAGNNIDLTVPSDYYAVLTIELTAGALLP